MGRQKSKTPLIAFQPGPFDWQLANGQLHVIEGYPSIGIQNTCRPDDRLRMPADVLKAVT